MLSKCSVWKEFNGAQHSVLSQVTHPGTSPTPWYLPTTRTRAPTTTPLELSKCCALMYHSQHLYSIRKIVGCECAGVGFIWGGGGGGGTPSMRVSRYAPRFCPPFSASGRYLCPPKFDHVYHFIQILLGPISKAPILRMLSIFLPHELTKYIILSRSCWVPFWNSSGAPLLIFTRCVIWYVPKPSVDSLKQIRIMPCESYSVLFYRILNCLSKSLSNLTNKKSLMREAFEYW